ncbi:MAG: hypothetical protein L0922_07750, partial [Candidatus Mariimomonas ferrooxydans]
MVIFIIPNFINVLFKNIAVTKMIKSPSARIYFSIRPKQASTLPQPSLTPWPPHYLNHHSPD